MVLSYSILPLEYYWSKDRPLLARDVIHGIAIWGNHKYGSPLKVYIKLLVI